MIYSVYMQKIFLHEIKKGGDWSQKNLISENFFRFPKSVFKKLVHEFSVCKLAVEKI
jgi:hypothetical protein